MLLRHWQKPICGRHQGRPEYFIFLKIRKVIQLDKVVLWVIANNYEKKPMPNVAIHLIRIIMIYFVTSINLAVMGQISFNQILELPYQAPDQTIAYGDSEYQHIEYWQSSTDGATQLVILIHGGCWLNAYSASHIRPIASKLQEHGYAVWSIEYRRIGDSGGGWPGSFDDILNAINLVQTSIEANFDNVSIMGHSAGGHLALWAATKFSRDSPFYNRLQVKIDRVVALAPISNLLTYAAGSSSCERATAQLLGGMPDSQMQRYELTSPHLLQRNVRTVLLHGEADNIVSVDQSRELERLSTLTTLRAMPELAHFDLIDPNGAAFQEILEALDD